MAARLFDPEFELRRCTAHGGVQKGRFRLRLAAAVEEEFHEFGIAGGGVIDRADGPQAVCDGRGLRAAEAQSKVDIVIECRAI